jgi:hypothetical protein
VVQIIDNNILVPIINTKVQINARIHYRNYSRRRNCGIAGMFLAIPILAILKIVFDRIESLEVGLFDGRICQKFYLENKKAPVSERNLKLIKYNNFR